MPERGTNKNTSVYGTQTLSTRIDPRIEIHKFSIFSLSTIFNPVIVVNFFPIEMISSFNSLKLSIKSIRTQIFADTHRLLFSQIILSSLLLLDFGPRSKNVISNSQALILMHEIDFGKLFQQVIFFHIITPYPLRPLL